MIFICCVALANGFATVISKMINYRATKHLGTWNGSLVNYIVGSILAFILLIATKGSRAFDWSTYASASPISYLGGTLGIIAFILTMITLPKMKVVYSTTLLLIGQLIAGIAFDAVIFQALSPLKIVGICMVAVGIIIDKRITSVV